MGFFNWVRDKLNATKTLSWVDIQDQYKDSVEEDPKKLSGVYACIEIISNTLAKLPFYVLDRKTKEHVEDDNLYWLLNYQPNQYMNAFAFKKYLAKSILCAGNGYVYPLRNKKNPLEIEQLIPIESDCVSISKSGNEVIYSINLDGKRKTLRYDELIHIKAYIGDDGTTGVSPLFYAKNTMAVGLNQERYQKQFYRKGGRPSGILETPTDVSLRKIRVKKSDGSEEDISYRKYIIDEFEKGQDDSGDFWRTALLDNGMKYTTVPQISPADMDFVNSKTVNLEDIARFFNVPAYKLGVGKQTYSNNEQAQIDYVTNCIVPYVLQWEQEFTLKLLTFERRKKGQVIKSNVEVELRGDTATRANWYDKMRSMGIYSINEIRAYEDLPSIKNGDARLIGANSVPLETLLSGSTVSESVSNPLSEDQENDDDETK